MTFCGERLSDLAPGVVGSKWLMKITSEKFRESRGRHSPAMHAVCLPACLPACYLTDAVEMPPWEAACAAACG